MLVETFYSILLFYVRISGLLVFNSVLLTDYVFSKPFLLYCPILYYIMIETTFKPIV